MIEEIWKSIPDTMGYEISSFGRVRTYWVKGRKGGLTDRPQRIRRTQVNSDGYLFISLKCDKNKKKTFNVHSLVASAFLGPKPPGLYACHNDGNKQNNIFTNLRYDTNSNNQLDAIKHNVRGKKEQEKRMNLLAIVAGTVWRPIESR